MITLESETLPLQMDEHGIIRVSGTRVTLDTIIGAYLEGASPESIAEAYSAVTLADVYATIAYYLRHRQAVDKYLEQGQHEADELRRQIESDPDYQLRRQRLLARARQQGLLK